MVLVKKTMKNKFNLKNNCKTLKKDKCHLKDKLKENVVKYKKYSKIVHPRNNLRKDKDKIFNLDKFNHKIDKYN